MKNLYKVEFSVPRENCSNSLLFIGSGYCVFRVMVAAETSDEAMDIVQYFTQCRLTKHITSTESSKSYSITTRLKMERITDEVGGCLTTENVDTSRFDISFTEFVPGKKGADEDPLYDINILSNPSSTEEMRAPEILSNYTVYFEEPDSNNPDKPFERNDDWCVHVQAKSKKDAVELAILYMRYKYRILCSLEEVTHVDKLTHFYTKNEIEMMDPCRRIIETATMDH